MLPETVVVGLDVGGTKIAGGLVDRTGKVLTKRRVALDSGKGDGKQPIEQICFLIEEFKIAAAKTGHELGGCGIAVPAVVDRSIGKVIWAPNIEGWNEYPLAEEVTNRTGLPVWIDHDGPAAVLGEQWVGAARGAHDVVLLIIGTGIGAGLFLDGRVYHGASGVAGAVGWSFLDAGALGDPLYRQKGFLETIAAGPAITKQYLESAGSSEALTTEKVFNLASMGDSLARSLMSKVCRYIGLCLANLISTLNPEVVVLSGGVGSNLRQYLPGIVDVIRLACQPLAVAKLRIVSSALGEDAGVIGAARLAFESMEVEIE